MMEEHLTELIRALGDDALTAYAIYMGVNAVEFLILVGLVTWGVRAVWSTMWPTIKKRLEEGF